MNRAKHALGLAILAAAALGMSANAFAAKPPKSNLPAPACLTANADAEAATQFSASWTDVPGANKYSVEYVASYDTDGDDVTDTSASFDFGAVSSPLVTLLADLAITVSCEADPINGCTYLPDDVAVHVKALNPPIGKWGAQNNPFTEFVTVMEDSLGTGGSAGTCEQ